MNPSSSQNHLLTALVEDENERLDRFLASRIEGMSRSRLKALIKTGQVRFRGDTLVEPNHRVKCGEQFELTIPEVEDATPKPEDIPLDVVHEDEHLIVIDKPAGMVVHPAAGNWNHTLVNALLHHCGDSLSGIGGVRRPGIVHRIDKDTSGLLVIAKNDKAHKGLSTQFADHGRTGPLTRAYLALVWGAPARTTGTIDVPLARSTRNRLKIAVVPNHQNRGSDEGEGRGKYAITHYELLKKYFDTDGMVRVGLVRCRLETGRTHQIRVHLAHIHHPLLGDDVYGAGFKASARNLPERAQHALKKLNRQALHAAELGFEHPVTGQEMRFKSRLPDKLQRLLDELN
jgi:23S rRNA pseudouridine1911/1915/1917 synthase